MAATWAALFLFLAALVAIGAADAADARAADLLRGPTGSWSAVSLAGDVPVLAVAAAIAVAWLWREQGPGPALRMAAGSAAAWVLGTTLKLLFSRERPPGGALEVASHAFPSGHALGSLVVFLLWARLAAPETLGLQRTAAVLALLVGWSRLALGVHHVSDVLAGWCLGMAIITVVGPRPSGHPTPDGASRRAG